MKTPYSQKVIEHFLNPRNAGKIENPDAKASEGSPACGDMVRVYLKVNPQTLVIEDIKFESFGCASNIATASMATEMVKGKTLEEAKKISWKDVVDALGGLPPVKVHCAVLAVDAIKRAIENYEHTHGILKEKKPTDKEVIRERLEHVIDPAAGMDVIRVGTVKDYEIKDGVVTVYLNIPAQRDFASHIKEEIEETLSPLWDVKEVRVIFSSRD
ncbi:iron-sulfur cluster assembly scaffold protein [bacterium]|nr:MAG: iron-sulfur cluster assembly scaffold protein [bacterium]RKZ22868.1 MAG: iron-sulfur cluster assembly scaffold protein [bacterium]